MNTLLSLILLEDSLGAQRGMTRPRQTLICFKTFQAGRSSQRSGMTWILLPEDEPARHRVTRNAGQMLGSLGFVDLGPNAGTTGLPQSESYNLIDNHPKVGERLLGRMVAWEEGLEQNLRGWMKK